MGRPLRARSLPDRSKILGEQSAPAVPHGMKIIREYALTDRRGYALTCSAAPKGTQRKMCYPSRAAAEACSAVLEKVGNSPQGAYPCDWANGEHWHLSRELA